MNNLIENSYVLHILWGYVRDIVNKLRYLALPIIYLTVILLVVPGTTTIINNVTYKSLDSYSYTVAIVTEESKLNNILKKYNLTNEQFRVLCGIVLSEADYNSYEDSYAVINTIYNRTHSKNWVQSIDNKYGTGKGMNLYYQAIAPNQFTVYASGSYLRHINDTNSLGYHAIIDFLYTENIMHNYLSFRAHNVKVNGSETFSDNGNNYFGLIKEENRI